jgi:hypothetical protein
VDSILDSILDQLQKDYSSFNLQRTFIQRTFSRYCSLSGKELSGVEGLTCRIPIHISESKVVVDNLALSRQNSGTYSHHWTQVYSPTQAKQIIGNSSNCLALLQWLQSWEAKCTGRKLNECKQRADCCDPNFDYSGGEEFLPAALLYGPHGSGKTAAVYACAVESGLKVCF